MLPVRRVRELISEWRPSTVTGGEAAYPLMVLFGLNAVDELDRTAYAVLLPEIRDHFGLGNTGILATVAVATVVILLLEIPLAHLADRRSRVRIATYGATAWALFAFGTGLAVTVAMLIVMRIGAGIGRSVVTPTHNSLLSDYYAPEHRVKVFGFHRLANSTGQILGPLLAGALAVVFGWRVPFLVLALPTLVLVLLASRLDEPVRGAKDRRADPDYEPQPPMRFWPAMRALAAVPTLRRVWMAVPFLAVALFAMPNLLSLIYEDLFQLSEFERGLIAAAAEPAQIVGVLVAMPFATRLVNREPAALLRFIAVVGVANGACIAVLAFAPNVAVAIAMHLCVAATVGILAPAVFAMLSMVLPAQCRSLGFTIISVFGIPGIVVVLPLIGYLADNHGLSAATLLMVPVTLAAGFVLASAQGTIADDIAANRAEDAEPAADPSDPVPMLLVEDVPETVGDEPETPRR